MRDKSINFGHEPGQSDIEQVHKKGGVEGYEGPLSKTLRKYFFEKFILERFLCSILSLDNVSTMLATN